MSRPRRRELLSGIGFPANAKGPIDGHAFAINVVLVVTLCVLITFGCFKPRANGSHPQYRAAYHFLRIRRILTTFHP